VLSFGGSKQATIKQAARKIALNFFEKENSLETT